MKRLLILLTASIAIQGCGDDSSNKGVSGYSGGNENHKTANCSDYCYAASLKLNMCTTSGSGTSKDTSECKTVASQCNYTQTQCDNAYSNVKAMSCQQFIDFFNAVISNGMSGVGCG